MSSLVKFAGARLVHQVDLGKLAYNVEWKIAPSSMALEMRGANPYYLSGAEKGQPVEGELAGNQRCYWPLGILHTFKYQSLVEVNPALYAMGDVSVPRIGEPGEDVPLVVRLRAAAPCNPHELDWLVRVYLLD